MTNVSLETISNKLSFRHVHSITLKFVIIVSLPDAFDQVAVIITGQLSLSLYLQTLINLLMT